MRRVRRAGAGRRIVALRRVGTNDPLRRLLLAFAFFRVAELAVWITITAYAFQVGGVRQAALVLVAQLVPASIFAMLVGGLMHRFGATRLLRGGYLAQSFGLGFAAVALIGSGPHLLVYAGAVFAATTVTVTRPCQAVIAPALVIGAEELTAANVVVGLIDGAAGLIGPATAAVLMSLLGTWAALAVMAAATASAAGLVWRLPGQPHSVADDDMDSPIIGLRTVIRTPGPRVLVAGLAAHSILLGAIDLLAVVMAVDLLGRRAAFAGWVTASFGAGMAIAGLAAIAVIGRERLAPGIIGSAVGAGVSLALVSVVGRRLAPVMVLVAACGLAASWYELTSRMLLQRIARLDLLGHVFSMVEAMQMAMLAIGSASVPVLVRWFGAENAPIGIGILMVVTVVLLAPALVRIDRGAKVPVTEMAALRASRLFSPLPAPALETLARDARHRDYAAGTNMIRMGDAGEEYFILLRGRVEVSAHGQVLNQLTAGEGFGEIALLHGTPRAATVQALEQSHVLVVDRPAFITAVTGHAPTLDGATAIAKGWSGGAVDREDGEPD